MNCPNCNKENIKDDICLDCGIDTRLYKIVLNSSDSLYNKALAKAEAGDLTTSIDYLNKSLVFNKKNINARNLLALVYLETGSVYECIKQLTISNKLNPNDLVASSYLEQLKNNQKNLEDLKESVKIYNQAIVYMNQKSDDMAIIQLKKAVEINQKFLEAHNLLALCYIVQKKDSIALLHLNKVLAIDYGNEKATKYKIELTGQVSMLELEKSKEKKPTEKKSKSFNYIEDNKGGSSRSFGTYSLVYIIIGIVIGVSIFAILIIPKMTTSNKTLIDGLIVEKNELEVQNNQLLKTNTETIANLEASSKELEDKNKALEARVSLQDKIQVLNDANDDINQGEYELASGKLSTIEKDGLPEEYIAKYEDLVDKSYTRTATILYQRGISRYRAKTYDDAEVSFNECMKYADIDSSQYGDSLYYLGEIALIRDNTTQANEYFTKVVENYRDVAKNYWSARNRLQ